MTALSVIQSFALTLFVVLWVVIGWGDLTHQKIRHKVMLYGVAGTAAAYAFLGSLTLLGVSGWVHQFPYLLYYGAVASHLALCACAAFFLWWMGIWPAGDTKLFVLLGALYPLLEITGTFRYEKLFLAALINTFLPAALVLFCRACYYIYATRLSHSVVFLRQLGWRRELGFFADRSVEILREAAGSAGPKLRAFLRGAAADPTAVVSAVFMWLVSMLSMALFSYYLRDFFTSPLKLTLLWTCLFTLWRRATEIFGPMTKYFVLVPIAALLILRPPSDWTHLRQLFANITIFSFFMYLGMNWAMRILSGGGGLPFLLPFLIPFFGLAVGQLWALAAWVVRRVFSLIPLPGLHGPHMSLGPAIPFFNKASAVVHGLYMETGLSGGSPFAHTILVLSAMGLFFGLSLVLVRLWDQEVQPTRSRETLAPYVVLAPAFVERLKQDSEFFAGDIGTLYADGLTLDQAEALKGWCAEHGIDTVPLAPTMSFAVWIFLGFFISYLLGGGHVLEVVF